MQAKAGRAGREIPFAKGIWKLDCGADGTFREGRRSAGYRGWLESCRKACEACSG